MKKPRYSKLRSQVTELNRQFDRRINDRSFEQEGGTVIYALDNDIITLITAPWKNKNRGYLRNLLNCDDEASESLAYIFANFFLHSGSTLPYVIIPPAEKELEGMWSYVYIKAKDEHAGLHAGLEKILDTLSEGSNQADEDHIFTLIRGVLECVYGRGGRITEVDRISRVIESGNVRRLDTVLNSDGSPPFPTESQKDTETIARRQPGWLKELNRIRPEEPDSNIVDATVLARLEWINDQYLNEQSKTRLCLITGDSHIDRVCSQRYVHRATFSELFIRTPSCFLADADFFHKANVESPDFVFDTDAFTARGRVTFRDWLHVAFPPSENSPTEFFTRKDEEVVISAISEADHQWSRYLRSAADSSRMSDQNFSDTIKNHIQEIPHLHINEIRTRFDNLKDRLEFIGKDAISRFGGSSALAGFWSLDYRNRRMERSIPGLKFDSLTKAAELAEQLRTSGTFQQLQHRVDRRWLQELRREDSSGYSTYVIFALAFALAGEWTAALTIAKTAMSIALKSREENPKNNIKGDEAAYLCAILSRFCAKSITDLEECGNWLVEAQRLQKECPIRKSLTNINLETYEDPRFRSEKLAIRLSRRYFALLHAGLQRSIAEQLSLKTSIRDECLEHMKAFDLAKAEPLSYVRQHICEQLSTSFLQLQILATHEKDKDSLFQDEARQFLEEIESGSFENTSPTSINENGFLGSSRLVYFVYLCASAIFTPEAQGWSEPESRRKLLRELEDNGEKLRLMPYDDARVKLFIKVARASLEE